MDTNTETIFNGIFITAVVGIISISLYYMFKNAAFTPHISLKSNQETINKRKKKTETKKLRKVKKSKFQGATQIMEIESDKTPTSDDTVEEEDEEHSSDTNLVGEDSLDEQLISKKILPKVDAFEDNKKSDLHVSNNNQGIHFHEDSPTIGQTNPIQSLSNDKENKDANDVSDSCSSPDLTNNFPQGDILPCVPRKKPKRSKRRLGKQLLEQKAVFSNSSVYKSHSEAIESSKETINIKNPVQQPSSRQIYNESLISELRGDLKALQEKLNFTDCKLKEANDRIVLLVEENERLKTKNEEAKLGLHVIEVQYNELLRDNKVLEHDKNMNDSKLKKVEAENGDLRNRLDQVNAQLTAVKNEAKSELRKLEDQLTETNSKLNTVTAVIASSPPPPSIPASPDPEIVRAQELAKVMSNDNCLLQSRVEQLESELNQLRQTNMRQQQDLQAFRSDNIKLHSEKEKAYEELRAKIQADQTEIDSRIASYEARLNRRCHELELEKQRNQEYMKTITDLRCELSRNVERENRQSEIISSLEYQFAELNAQKKSSLDDISQTKLTNELHAQLINLTNELICVKTDYDNAQHKLDELTMKMENTQISVEPNHNMHTNKLVSTSDVAVTANTYINGEEINEINQINHKNHDTTLEGLIKKLNDAENNIKNLQLDADNSRNLYKSTLIELENYKLTLMQTEELLANIESCAEKAESKWYRLLTESEAERNKLQTQLAESHLMTTNASNDGNLDEHKIFSNYHTEENNMSRNRTGVDV